MVNRFVVRQAVTAALTANAVRPLPGFRVGVPAFFAGWLTGELAPHALALTAADTPGSSPGADATRSALPWPARALPDWATSSCRAGAAVHVAEDALVEALGVDYVEQLDEAPTPAASRRRGGGWPTRSPSDGRAARPAWR